MLSPFRKLARLAAPLVALTLVSAGGVAHAQRVSRRARATPTPTPTPTPTAIAAAHQRFRATFHATEARAFEVFGLRRSEPLVSRVSPEEAVAIRLYTGGEHGYRWNRVLRSHDKRRIAPLQAEITVLSSALSKLPGYHGTVARTADLPPQVLRRYRVGQVVTEHGFLSTSKKVEHQVPTFGLVNVRFEIVSHGGGKDVTPFSLYNEQEVLFAPKTRFRVVSRQTKSLERGGTLGRPVERWPYELIRLEEVHDSRSSTPQANDRLSPSSGAP